MFAAAPHDFDAVEFGAVGRQKKQGQSGRFPVGDAGAEGGRAMGGRVVEDHHRGLGAVLAKVIEETDNIVGIQALLARVGVQVSAVVAQEPGHVHARAARGGQGHRLAGGLPGAGHVGNEGEAGFVKIVEVEVVGVSQAAQQVQLEGGRGKGQRVALGFQRVADSLKPPPPGFLIADTPLLSSTGRHGWSRLRPARLSDSAGVRARVLPAQRGARRRVCACGLVRADGATRPVAPTPSRQTNGGW